MTTIEHALVGAFATLATGLPKKVGWQIVAVAAVAAISPDWDGLPILFSMQWFDRVHRVWGHNLGVAAGVGMLLAVCDYFWDWTTRAGRWLQWLLDRQTSDLVALAGARPVSWLGLWGLVGILAAWSHLPADMVYSGNSQLGDWPLCLFWPMSDKGYVYPLVPWGDIGASVLFMLGVLAMLRWRRNLQSISACTLVTVIGYILIRGYFW